MKTYFQRIDFDKDGSITRKDFEGMGERFVEAEKLDATAGASIKDKLNAVWDKYMSGVGKPGEAITEPVFIDAMAGLVASNAKDLADTLKGPLPLFFQAVDANGDDQIDQGEFKIFFEIFGLPKESADLSFQAIDTNSDGYLSKDEFVDAGSDFFVNEDTACPTKLFWGPLVCP